MNTKQQFTEVEFGQQKVKVPKGGYYDRFRMNPDLDEVAQDPAVGNIDFFRHIPKKIVESRVGPVWAPNFYYRSANVQLLMLAPIKRIKAKLPADLTPLQPFPGYGLVAVTFFTYSVCDNDPYNEVSIAIVVRKPNTRGSQIAELIKSMRQRHFYAHVLALPVDTEIARVRGVYGYQLPKWLTKIDVNINQKEVQADIFDVNGKLDLSLKTAVPTLKHVDSETHINRATMLHVVDGKWHQTEVESNILSFAQKLFPKNVQLEKNEGPLTTLLNELGASKILRLDVVEDAQVVLNLPIKLL
ncbi:acetoacetate decarboxylase family protein [Acinetobacter pittii]|uniref:acetoacetate decarboxylase family protein n=1 Tax=Acinetobacter pittii TaxID=48296 RepID=UPI00030729D0|nr:acetoacetate decarboxylase family protein [Acinetobacter pittii]MDX8276488.1 acetoacetate decarboxylase family protein [Acinetobacter pittii]SSP30037.1 Acetoacetate decarboxylase (ADC) [Acinetobacter pittii]